jgi:hypothetical protein
VDERVKDIIGLAEVVADRSTDDSGVRTGRHVAVALLAGPGFVPYEEV